MIALNFVILGLPLALLFWVWRRPQLGKWLSIGAAAAALLLVAGIAYFLSPPPRLGPDDWFEQSPWKEGLLLLAMLVGMAARSLDQVIELRSQEIAQLRAAGKPRRKPKLRLDPWDFSRPFLVALPTFGGLLGQISDQLLGWALVVLAFQTGFFWQTVLKKSEPLAAANPRN